jgi:hypothetical protein
MTDKKNEAASQLEPVEAEDVEPGEVEAYGPEIATSYPEHDLGAAEVLRAVIRGDGVLLLTIAAPRK